MIMKSEPLTKEKILKMKDPYGHFNTEMLRERCEEGCEAWYCYLLNHKEEW